MFFVPPEKFGFTQNNETLTEDLISTCLKSSYYKSAAAQIVRQRSLESIASSALSMSVGHHTSFLYPTTATTHLPTHIDR